MSYKSEKIPIAGTINDKRVKLTQEQKEAVKTLYEQGYSMRKLAAIFNVSKWLIQNTVAPVDYGSVQKKYSKEYMYEIKKRYRKRKQELYKSGKIKLNE